MEVERQAFPRADELMHVDVEPVVHRPAVCAARVDAAADDRLVVLRQPELDVDAVLGEVGSQPPPVTGELLARPDVGKTLLSRGRSCGPLRVGTLRSPRHPGMRPR